MHGDGFGNNRIGIGKPMHRARHPQQRHQPLVLEGIPRQDDIRRPRRCRQDRHVIAPRQQEPTARKHPRHLRIARIRRNTGIAAALPLHHRPEGHLVITRQRQYRLQSRRLADRLGLRHDVFIASWILERRSRHREILRPVANRVRRHRRPFRRQESHVRHIGRIAYSRSPRKRHRRPLAKCGKIKTSKGFGCILANDFLVRIERLVHRHDPPPPGVFRHKRQKHEPRATGKIRPHPHAALGLKHHEIGIAHDLGPEPIARLAGPRQEIERRRRPVGSRRHIAERGENLIKIAIIRHIHL